MVEKSIKKKKYCLFTYGCTFNFGDSAKIQKILEDHSFEESDLSEAEYIIFNTCAVKHATEAKTLNFIKKNVEKYPSKKFIIGGCLPQIDKKIEFYLANLIPDQILIISPHNIAQIYEEIQKKWYLNLSTEIKSSYNRDKSYLYPKIKNRNSPAIIQISEGCNNHCAYCCTRIARGKLISFNPENIIIQIEKIASQGVKEFHLTSEDLGNYNYNGMLLHHLLKKISDIKGDLLFRLGMLNPDYLVKYCDEFLDIFSDKRFYRFIHMPIQSASNEILKKMYRNYNQEEIV
ncbi:MAG: radical SAM protein, partial [Promethearchaeota archaeon]